MVSVDDLGQGSEAIRLLGIRWLSTGAADKSVDEKGNLKSASDKEANDRSAPGERQQEEYEEQVREEAQDIDPESSKKKEEEKEAKKGAAASYT